MIIDNVEQGISMSNHVMLVEDNASFRKVMKAILNARLPSIKISEAEGERGAMDICSRAVPDLVLMDLGLADGGGLPLTRQIKRLSPDTMVVVTSHDSPEYAQAAFDSGADFENTGFTPFTL